MPGEIERATRDLRQIAESARRTESDTPPAIRVVMPFWRGVAERHRAAVLIAAIAALAWLAANGSLTGLF